MIQSIFCLTLCLMPIYGFSQKVPGNVVCFSAVDEQKYIGSPSLVVMPNGDYVASHDFFGPQSSEWQQAESRIFISKDQGKKWKQVSTIKGAFWSSLFVHQGDLYFLGPDRHHGTVLIRKSSNAGKTWTQPTNRENGVLLTGEFHCAPMPVVSYAGRLWRPMETAHGPVLEWGKRYAAMVMSADENADLLNAKSWQVSNAVPYQSHYLSGNFGGWLEGNFVVGKDQQLWNILRVDDRSTQQEKAAFLKLSKDGKQLSFDESTGFREFPGGSKKFVIKYDEPSAMYYTLVNVIPEKYAKQFPDRSPSTFRNVLMLRKSKDLTDWVDVKIILEHEDVIYHGFQYVDWLIENDDLIFLSRTAYFDGNKKAKNNHDANYLTFHRIEDFRKL
ncbi:sialidase family protein [Sphingobacterium sp. HJSM2_6]|uniref:sialidase family protein n=1 Tax=Sphingobacterium sp. HJSM2_6 TaxID=3366264 RepID=UPI003BDA9745